MASFLSVSGLGNAEEDALSRLLAAAQKQGSSSPSATANTRGLEDALRKTQADVAFDDSSKPTAARGKDVDPADAQATEKPRRSTAGGGTTTATTTKALISNRVEPLPRTRKPDAAGEVPAALAPGVEGQSAFRADNPEDAEALPEIADLVHPKLLRPLQETMGIDKLTRIQKLSWRAMVNGDVDVIVRSETGSGKTLAYALPVLHAFLERCDAQPISRDFGTAIIVMCPTRELVLQVSATLTTLLRCAQFVTVGGIHGGDNRHKEKARLRKGLTVLVTTPGRLLDHLKTTSAFKLDNMQTVIMDEADRLLDMGFEKPVREIMESLQAKCKQPQHLKRALVSATVTDAVERLSHFALRKHIVRIGETEDIYTIPSTLRQHCMSIPVKHRLAVLLTFLRSQLDAGATKIVVFTSTADAAEFLYYLTSRLESPFLAQRQHGKVETRPKTAGQSTKKMVELANRHVYGESDEVVTFDDDDDAGDADEEEDNDENGRRGGQRDGGRRHLSESSSRYFVDANVFKLHGNMTQVDRSSVFRAFKNGTGNRNGKCVLFCTDVAARGLDMPQVDWIVHYDPPADPTSYIHRVGRTARIGNSGDSILFLAPHEMGYAEYLTNFIHAHGQSEDKEQHDMTQRKYESFLFYLTKLDPKSHHMWVQSTATLERGISQLVMRKREHIEEESSGDGGTATTPGDDLGRIALFAYQSYIRAYAGMPKAVKNLFFDQSFLHLGHVANSFGINRSPTELQRQLRSTIREDHNLSRDNRKGTASRDTMESRGMKRQRVEIENDSRYHSMIAQKQRKTTRDWAEKRREESNRIKPLQFSEFDA